jgi:hypothetical protein
LFFNSDQSNTHSFLPSFTHPPTDFKTIEQPPKQKRTSENLLEKAAYIVSILIQIKN